MPAVNPEILIWARESAGLDRSEAATKIQLRAARGVGPEERMAELESGAVAPTRPQLVRLSKAYRQPLVAFYLEAPPLRGDRGADFRTTLGEPIPEEEAWLDHLIRDVRTRHDLIRAALEGDEDVAQVAFVGESMIDEGAEVLKERLIKLIGFDRKAFRKQPSMEEAFRYLRERVEETGVFALLKGDLGSYHTAISVETFRGYALADSLAPMIVINDQDAQSAWSFTLLHEFCHLMLGHTAVSGGFDGVRVERVCNDVASLTLLDDGELSEILIATEFDVASMAREIGRFAAVRRVSHSLVALRLWKQGRLTPHQWKTLSARFKEEWIRSREYQRLKRKDQEGGPTYYVLRRHRLGPALLGTVNYLMKAGEVSVVKAARILDVKPGNVHETLAVAER